MKKVKKIGINKNIKCNEFINNSYKCKTMSSYWLKRKKNTEKNTKCSICGSEKLTFLKNQEARGVLRNLGLKILLSKILLLGDIFFWNYKVNEKVNECLLAGDTFMLEMHLKHL